MILAENQVQPDFDSLIDVLHRRRKPDRVYQAELFMDTVAKDGLRERFSIAPSGDENRARAAVRDDAALYEFLGYELVRVHAPAAEFDMDVHSSLDTDTGDFKRSTQGYIIHEHGGPVQNEQDLKAYPWPEVSKIDTAPFDWAEEHLPEGMRGYDLTMQVFEAVSWLLGYETLFISMIERPEFVDQVLERVGNFFLDYTRFLCRYDSIGVIWGTDDMGYKTGTMVSPDWLREKILPWHTEAARIAHDAGKQYFLHSCGHTEAIMPDIISEVGIDAKHSFEDDVIPVTDFYDRYSNQIGVIGGMDLDFLCRASEDEVRRRTRELLDHCYADGGYVLGTGNSVTDYVPLDNFIAMLEEGRRYR